MEASKTELRLAAIRQELATLLEQVEVELPKHADECNNHHDALQGLARRANDFDAKLHAATFAPEKPPGSPTSRMNETVAIVSRVQRSRGPHFALEPAGTTSTSLAELYDTPGGRGRLPQDD